jgi:hypothetical protein
MPADGPAAPRSAGEALARAREHARLAAAEGLAAFRLLLDAGALATAGTPSAEVDGLAGLTARLAELDAALREGTSANALVGALAAALDTEIGRWEERSADDAEARAVLRAFLGLRELLWELGVRAPAHRGEAPRARGAEDGAPDARAGASRRGVRRVPVEG